MSNFRKIRTSYDYLGLTEIMTTLVNVLFYARQKDTQSMFDIETNINELSCSRTIMKREREKGNEAFSRTFLNCFETIIC